MMDQAAVPDLSSVVRLCEAEALRCSDRGKRFTPLPLGVALVLSAGEIWSETRGAIAAFA